MPNVTPLTSPLSDLNSKGQLEIVRWTQVAKQAFQSFKDTLTMSLILRNPYFQLPFLDTSETGLGAVFSQEFEWKEHPVIYIRHFIIPFLTSTQPSCPSGSSFHQDALYTALGLTPLLSPTCVHKCVSGKKKKKNFNKRALFFPQIPECPASASCPQYCEAYNTV